MSENWKDFVKTAKESREVVHRNPVTGLGYDKNWLPVIDLSKLPPVQKGTDSNQSVMGAAPYRPKVDYRMLREQLASGGNGNPDEMLGKRMNPILIAPGMVAGGAPATAMSAIRQGALANLIAHGMENLSKSHPTVAKAIAAANVGMTAAPLIRSGSAALWNKAVNKIKEIKKRHYESTDEGLMESIRRRVPDDVDVSPTFLRRRLFDIISQSPRHHLSLKERLAEYKRGKEGIEYLRRYVYPLTLEDKLRFVRGGEDYIKTVYPEKLEILSSRRGPLREYRPINRFGSIKDIAEALGVTKDSTSHVFKGGPPVKKWDPNRYGFFSGNIFVAGKHQSPMLMSADLGKGYFSDLVRSRFTPHLTRWQQVWNNPEFAKINRDDFLQKLMDIKAGKRPYGPGFTDVDYSPNYEVVLRGDEAQRLPWRYFQERPQGGFFEIDRPTPYPTRGRIKYTVDSDMREDIAGSALVGGLSGF